MIDLGKLLFICCSVAKTCPTFCDPHGLQHARPPSPSPSPRVCPSSYSLHQWRCPAISSSNTLFSFCPQSFPASGTLLTSHLFSSDDQNSGASALASVLPVNIQDWFLLGLTGLISLQSKGLTSLLQQHSSKVSILWCSAFFMVQLSHLYMTTGKNHSFDYTDLWQQSDVSAFQYAV